MAGRPCRPESRDISHQGEKKTMSLINRASEDQKRSNALLFTLLGAILIALTATTPAQAAFTPITTCSVINVPGDYEVTADLVAGANNGCIGIAVSGVSLKLNGHKISAPTTVANFAAGIGVGDPRGGRLDHVAIEGPGLIEFFGTGVAFSSADYCQVGLVTIVGNGDGIFAVDVTFLTIASNVAVQNTDNGVLLDNSVGGVIENNDASGNGTTVRGNGIVLNGGADNTVNNNTVNANFNGIVVEESGDRLFGNRTNGNTGDGIFVLSGGGNQIFSNPSSVGNGIFDMSDINSLCGTDLWSSNVFFTPSQPCVH
jgi:parallel beta-helix repeat protein